MLKFIDSLPLSILIVMSLTLGLAPFFPEPHLFEKIKMLANGELHKPIDIFDMLMHATPWLLLFIKLGLLMRGKSAASENEG